MATVSAKKTGDFAGRCVALAMEMLKLPAQQMWLRGHYGAAIGKAEAALDAEPKPAQAMQAYEIIATCSCALGRADAAREAMSHLNNTKREAVKTVCEKKGVTIE